MKKILIKVSYVLILLFAISACKKNELTIDDTLQFSKLTVEDQKQKIEENGISFVEKMEGVQNTQAYKTLSDFSATTDGFSVIPMKYLKAALDNRSVKSLSVLNKQLKSVSEDYSDVWGKYSWDPENGEFVKESELTDKLILEFPSSSSDKSNNAVLTITYEGSEFVIPDVEINYPTKISCVLKIDGETALTADLTASYDKDGNPTSAKNSLELGDYSWTASISNDLKNASEEYELKFKKETLIKLSSQIKGNLDINTIENAESPDGLVTYLSVYFQLMNVAVVGGTKEANTLIDEMNALNESTTIEYESREYYEEYADILNNNMILYACFVDDKRKFADVEFYVDETTDTYTYYDYVWNGSYYETIERTETTTGYSLAPRFILSDGSKEDVENYFQTGFDDLIDQLNESFDIEVDL